MKRFVFGLLFLLVPVVLSAQATQTSKLVWDMPATSLAEANGYTYGYYADGGTTRVTLTGVTCAGTASPFTCQANFPAFTPGSHTLQLSASNIAGEGPKSGPFAFTFVVVPGTPLNIRIGG